jgi:light-regulated signal transduction histidine kinase (bacteriophytochrome)
MSATPDLLDEAVRNCAAEPIHRPGAILPHGRLLVIDNGELRGRSTNVAAGDLHGLFPDDEANRLLDAIAAADPSRPDTLEELRSNDGALWSALLHADGHGGALVELEPATSAGAIPLRLLNDTIVELQRAQDIHDACTTAVRAIAGITGFDRVMAYRFLPDWSGEVVAEALHPGVASFLGLRFPASDIPPQARALYARARVRIIPDSGAPTVPVETALAALDLGACVLRAVSPVHLQYLANMGVAASMSVAILSADNALWGLIACHHERGPLLVGHALRQAADTIGRTLAWRLADLSGEDAARGRLRAGELRELIATDLADPAVPPEQILAPIADKLLAAAGGDVLALVGPDLSVVLGRPTLPVDAADLAGLLDAASHDGMLVTDRLADALSAPLAATLAESGLCGILAERLAEGVAGTWIVWLRGELLQRVDWAGNPDKTAPGATVRLGVGGLPTLNPRHSFASWREEVRGRSAPFTAADRAAARLLADFITRAFLRRAEAVEQLNRDLRQRNDDLRFFADAAVHDLREPLWQIQVFSSTLREDLAAMEGPEAAALVDTARVVESSAARMRQLVDELSNFATAGRFRGQPEQVSLTAAIDHAATDLAERLREAGASLHVTVAGDASVRGDAGQLGRLFQNLISNAVKYRAPERALEIRIDMAAASAGHLSVQVTDNGLGFDPADAERIFEPFQRLDSATVEGMGLGLAICRRIAQAHGGSISADGRLGEGASFTVDLSIAGPPE